MRSLAFIVLAACSGGTSTPNVGRKSSFSGPTIVGTVTSVICGTGMSCSPSPITRNGTISVDTTALQQRIAGTCAAGTAIGTVNADGSVACNTAGSTYTAGTGMQLVGTVFSVNLTPTSCAAGQAETATASTGTSTCNSVLTTPGTGLATGGGGDVHVNLTTTSCSAGQAETATAANGTSTCSTFINAGTGGVACTGSTCQLDSSYSPTFAGLTDTGPIALSGVITVTDTGTQNDYNPPGLAGASTIIFNNASSLTINGLTGGVAGRIINVCAVNAAVNFAQEAGTSTAGNRFNILGAVNGALSVAGSNKPACGQLIYIGGTTNRWTQLNLPASQSIIPVLTFSAQPVFNAGVAVQGNMQLSGVAHIRTATVSPPTLSSCGTGATVVGGDSMMTVTTGTGATSCMITFGSSAWGSNHPACIVYNDSGGALPAVSYTGVISFALGSGTAASTTYEIHCQGTN